MLAAYLKLALRSLVHDRLFSAIKLVGLTVGLVCCLLIGLYVRHELSYDAFHERAERIARVTMEYGFGGETARVAVTGTRVAPAFEQAFPEVEKAVRVISQPRVVSVEGQPPLDEEQFFFADSTFFEIFSFPLVAGDAREVLDGPEQLVISETKARAYFGGADPVGLLLRVENSADYTITGVMRDAPTASQMKPDFVASFHSLPAALPERETWWSANYATYLLLGEPRDVADLQAKIPAYMRARSEETGVTGEDYLTFHVEPLRDVHLRSELPGNFEPGGDIRNVYILSVVGLLILGIGSSIYINLSIAASAGRARQIGVQKVLGATPGRLFRQHLTEAMVVCGAALLLSVPITTLLIPSFNDLFSRSLSLAALLDPSVLILLVAFGTAVAVLAGSYPALVLSRLKPSSVLRANHSISTSDVWLRKGLVAAQFFVSIGLIICTLVLQDQMNYIRSKNLGYDKDHVVVIRVDPQTEERMDAVRSEFLQSAGVESLTLAYETPTYIEGGYGIAASPLDERMTPVTALPADEFFIETFDVGLLAGRGITSADVDLAGRINEGLDSTSSLPIVVNASQARALGWTPEEAVGRRVRFQGAAEIRGVVDDFHFASMHEPIGNLVIFPSNGGNRLMIRLDGRLSASTLAFLEDRWTSIVPHRPFSYHFLDDEFDHMYRTEIQTTRMARAFSGVAILLACLGLFAVASYSIVQRTKEIGIRKVLGASMFGLVALLSADFLKLVILAFVLAVPVTYVAMSRWLADFAYRTDLSWSIFAGAGGAAVLIALLTVTYQAVRTALLSPVRCLREE